MSHQGELWLRLLSASSHYNGMSLPPQCLAEQVTEELPSCPHTGKTHTPAPTTREQRTPPPHTHTHKTRAHHDQCHQAGTGGNKFPFLNAFRNSPSVVGAETFAFQGQMVSLFQTHAGLRLCISETKLCPLRGGFYHCLGTVNCNCGTCGQRT